MGRVKASLLLLAACICAAASALTWFLFFTLYWPHRTLFDEQGRYVDEAASVVYHQQSGVLAIPALIFLVLAVSLSLRCRRGALPDNLP